jgi:hypothetical protein
MNSLWLCRDALPVRPTGGGTSRDLYMGIFTEDPVTIACMIPRPRAPFVPTPARAVVLGAKGVGLDDGPEGVECESLPVSLEFAVSEPIIATIPGGFRLF